jgi:hypothetical protein
MAGVQWPNTSAVVATEYCRGLPALKYWMFGRPGT